MKQAPIIYYQGEPGAFSEEAVKRHWPEAVPQGLPSFADVVARLVESPANVGLLPIENAYAGTVYDVLDLMIQHQELAIWAEVVLRVELALIGLPGMTLDQVKKVRSHPQALMQSRGYWQARGWTMEVASDTAGSARELSQFRWPGVAAIASPQAAREYGLEILVNSIQDHPDNRTRFWLVAQREPDWRLQNLTVIGHKTSIVFDTFNAPGSLVRALLPFANRNVNLSKVDSRPRPHHAFAFQFWIDCEGSVETDRPLAEAVEELGQVTERYRILGSYGVLKLS
jgi:prephenate dehydratase